MKKKLFLACFLFAILAYVPSASAITFDLNTPFGPAGAGVPVQPPLLTAAFENATGGVQLILSASGLSGNAYVSEWYFNVFQDRFIFPLTQQSFLWSPNQLPAGSNSQNDTLGYGFDVLISFPVASSTSNFEDLFGPLDSATVLLSSTTPGISADWFNELNAAGAFYASAKILKFGEAGESWIASGPVTAPSNPVPEPATMLMLGVGLTGVVFFGRKKF